MFYPMPKPILKPGLIKIRKKDISIVGQLEETKIPERAPHTNDPVKQLHMAKLINNLLKVVKMDTYLIGGTIRDWHLNKQMKDFDFYCILKEWDFGTVGFSTMESMLESLLFEELGFIRYFNKTELNYDRLIINLANKNITIYILNFFSQYGHRLQLMITASNTTIEELISHFDCSICEYYYDFKTPNSFYTSELNLHYLKTNSVLVSYESRKSEHMERVRAKFPEYNFLAFPYMSNNRMSKFIPLDLDYLNLRGK